MNERDLVWLDLEGKWRPGVVLAVHEEWIEVIYGTRTEREWPSVVVHPDTRQGRQAGLKTTTYFYAATRRFARAPALRRVGPRCSVELYLELRALVEADQ